VVAELETELVTEELLEEVLGAELGAEELVAELFEEAARLLYICKAFEPPQNSNAFPLQTKVQAVDPTTLPA
jgi:hypothetical protein